MRYTKKIVMPIAPAHGQSRRAMEYAAGRPRTSVTATTRAPTHREFQAKVGKLVSVRRKWMWSKVGGRL